LRQKTFILGKPNFFKYIFFLVYYIMTHKIPTIGSRIQVYRGHAKKTSGGLTKSDLMMNKHGRVVSKAKHMTAKKEMRLLKHGYGTKKGKFGYVKVGKKSRSKKMKGGMFKLFPEEVNSGAGIAGADITNFGKGSNAVQMRAAMAGGSGMAHMSDPGSANWNGDSAGAGITNFGPSSIGVQLEAGMSGGRRRKHRGGKSMALARSRALASSKARSRGLAMRGGTGNRGGPLGSDAVQLRAGLGN
jgi:hypothetical protein